MTVTNGTIQCDTYGCQSGGLIDLPSGSVQPDRITPYDVRGWFAMEGWVVTVGPGGTQGLVDHCPLHIRACVAGLKVPA
jgi:hypothetical protein